MSVRGTLGFLGFGNMGRAIAGGLLENGATTAKHLAAYDVDSEKCAHAEVMGLRVTRSAEDLARACDTLVLAVKPQSMDEAVTEIQTVLKPATLVVSIAAGISIGYLQERLGAEFRVVRVMPNTPALVGAGATGIAPSPNCKAADVETAHAIFRSIGVSEQVPESLIDAVTALSGSGPAYFFYLVECLSRAAVAQGLPKDQADRLASQTLVGAGLLLRDSGESATILRERVTSRGGTTEAALKQFECDEFPKLVESAVAAAVQRSRELGQ